MKLILSTQARRNLREIALWIASDDPVRAQSYTEELRAACEKLLDHPLAFPALVDRRGRKLHKRTYGNYLIICEVDGKSVRVTAILHGARDRSRLI